jgi:hypothetical protein
MRRLRILVWITHTWRSMSRMWSYGEYKLRLWFYKDMMPCVW